MNSLSEPGSREVRVSGGGCGDGAARFEPSPHEYSAEKFPAFDSRRCDIGTRGVVFPVSEACDGGDGNLRHEFADEDDAAPGSATDVKAEIHFFKGLMKRDCAAEQAGFVELESDEACVGVAFVEIEFCASRNEGPEKSWVNAIVQHEQVLPFGGEEGALLSGRGHQFFDYEEKREVTRYARHESSGPDDLIEVGCADPGEFSPCGEPLAYELRSAWSRNTGDGHTGFDGFCEWPACTDGAKGVKLTTLQAEVVDGIVDTMSGKPGRLAADLAELRGRHGHSPRVAGLLPWSAASRACEV